MATPGETDTSLQTQEADLGRRVPDLIHQIRNPLSSILTSAELLGEENCSDAMREKLLPVVLRSAKRIRDLLSEMETHVPGESSRGSDTQ